MSTAAVSSTAALPTVPTNVVFVVLVVHHTPSPAMQSLLEAVEAGISAAAVELGTTVDVRLRPALVASPIDVLEADAIVLGTPANIGYMSGALKHFFDQTYYPCLSATVGLPYALYVHGNDDTTGAVKAIERIAKGLQWKAVAAPIAITGQIKPADLALVADAAGLVTAAACGLL